MTTKKYCLLSLFAFFSVVGISQTQDKIDVNTDIDLVKVYTQVVKEGYGTSSVYKELANAYYFKSNYKESKKWFEKLFDEETIADKTVLFRYQQSLKALGLYTEDNEFLVANYTN